MAKRTNTLLDRKFQNVGVVDEMTKILLDKRISKCLNGGQIDKDSTGWKISNMFEWLKN